MKPEPRPGINGIIKFIVERRSKYFCREEKKCNSQLEEASLLPRRGIIWQESGFIVKMPPLSSSLPSQSGIKHLQIFFFGAVSLNSVAWHNRSKGVKDEVKQAPTWLVAFVWNVKKYLTILQCTTAKKCEFVRSEQSPPCCQVKWESNKQKNTWKVCWWGERRCFLRCKS